MRMVVRIKVGSDEIRHVVLPVAIRRNRVEGAHQGDCNHVPSMSKIRVTLLHVHWQSGQERIGPGI